MQSSPSRKVFTGLKLTVCTSLSAQNQELSCSFAAMMQCYKSAFHHVCFLLRAFILPARLGQKQLCSFGMASIQCADVFERLYRGFCRMCGLQLEPVSKALKNASQLCHEQLEALQLQGMHMLHKGDQQGTQQTHGREQQPQHQPQRGSHGMTPVPATPATEQDKGLNSHRQASSTQPSGQVSTGTPSEQTPVPALVVHTSRLEQTWELPASLTGIRQSGSSPEARHPGIEARTTIRPDVIVRCCLGTGEWLV